jgi:hypothetical protein
MKASWRDTGLIVCLGPEQKIRDGEATLRRIFDAPIEDWRYLIDTLDIIGRIQRLVSAPYQENRAQGIATAIIRYLNSEAAMENL